ncbi:hypothetical protein, partial [Pseudomonas syringae]|uniref:hypothetical protein n=1 Tax=Pseudomonas syringae TaxID=317 RepID=UPI001F307F94
QILCDFFNENGASGMGIESVRKGLCPSNSGQRKARDGGAGLRIHTWEQLYNDAAAVKTL